MAVITKIIEVTGEEAAVIAAEQLVARARGWTAQILNPEWTEQAPPEITQYIDNPISSEQVALEGVREYLRETAKLQALTEAQQQAAGMVDGALGLITINKGIQS